MLKKITIIMLFITLSPVGALAALPLSDALFVDSEILELTLTGPFSLIDKERDKSKRYEGTLAYITEDNTTVSLDVAYEVRGNWRLKKANCSHAQLWLDLKRGQTKGTLFEDQNRLKLVVQCGRRETQEQWLIKEQLAYEFFTEFSDYGFDTRLVRATYSDSLKQDQQRTHFAFIIENQNRLAKRFDLNKFELNSAELKSLDPVQANRVALFMLLIANTDFSLSRGAPDDECCHNAKLLTDAAGVNYAFPYDFDSSGFVDASYAAPPNASMNINRNTQRLYRGYCSHADSLLSDVAYVLNTQTAVEGIVESSQFASDRTKKKALRFLSSYYEDLSSDRKVQRNLVGKCR